MQRTSFVTGTVVCLLLTGTLAHAQTDIDTDLFAGRIGTPDARRQAPPAGTVAATREEMTARIMELAPADEPPPPRYEILLNPVVADSDTATTGVLTTGIIVPARRLRATVSYSYIDPSASDNHLDNFGGAIRWKAWARTGAGVTLLGSHSDTRDVNRKTQVGVVGEFLVAGPVTFGADLRWARKTSSTAETDDLVPLATLGVHLGRVILGGGYTFRNDVDASDNFEAQVEVPLSFGAISGAVGKHGTWRLAFARKFGFH